VTSAMPAFLVGLTALVTGAMVHAGFGLWWLLENHLLEVGAAYDWTGALTASGTATTIVLIAGLLARRLVAGAAGSARTGTGAGRAGPRRAARRPLDQAPARFFNRTVRGAAP